MSLQRRYINCVPHRPGAIVLENDCDRWLVTMLWVDYKLSLQGCIQSYIKSIYDCLGRKMLMYVPKLYRLETAEALTVMETYPFAILITVLNNRPIATHVPVELRESHGKIYISGHLAYGNEQKHTLDENSDVLLVFHGPHSYISSSWYEAENVPTWDYVAVHAYGKARILSEDELERALAVMLAHYEAHRENGRHIGTFTPGYIRDQMKGIVGFEIEITSVEGSGKLSQNRNDTDYKSIVRELETSGAEDERKVAEWIRDGRPHLF